MPTFRANVRVMSDETWEVEAADEAEARKKFEKMTEDVETDDSGGSVADWDVRSIKEIA
jgi:hypothetical protein